MPAYQPKRRVVRVLQSSQRRVLEKLRSIGKWHPGCGWTYPGFGDAYTRRICESLVVRGLLVQYRLGEETGYCLPERVPAGARILGENA
jgi:hypothetical protein